ncbi:MAG: outer membrane protein assembly factor BamC [Pseudomonadota bacterium]
MNPIARLAASLSASCCLLTLFGCSGAFIESKKVDYKSATTVASLETPPDLTAPTQDDRFSVPDAGGKGSASFSDYRADRSSQVDQQKRAVLPVVDKAHIERGGTQRWLVVESRPEDTWQIVKSFWQDNGFVIAAETPAAGVMETDWAENRAKIPQDMVRNLLGKVLDSLYSSAERDKFRTRLEPGSKPGTTDIFVSHHGMLEVFVSEGKDQTRWQPRPADPDLEAEMLRRLMLRFGGDEKANSPASMPVVNLPEKAQLTRSADGVDSLLLKEKFDRAWRRVGLALDRVGFTVEDRDRAKGIYFVRYVDPDADAQKKEGFFSKLAFWKESSKIDTQTQYRVLIKDVGASGSSSVQILSREGGSDASETAKKILALLYEQLK